MHRSERNLDVRVGITPTIYPIYRRNNLENNLQNNGINFSKQPVVFENKPTIAITKAKARATAKATAKAITKENLSSCQADKPPRERSFLFLDRMILVKRRMAVQEAFALPWVHPLSFAFAQQLPQRGSQEAVAGAGSIQRSALFHPQAGGYEPPLRLAVRHDGYIPCDAQRPFPISIQMHLSQSGRKHYEKTDHLFYQ